MNLEKKLDKYWKYLETKQSPPKYVGRVNELQFSILKKAIDKKNEKFLKSLIRKMYINKEAFILKGCATKGLKKVMLDLANHFKKNKKPNFYKMYDGVPNFHRAIDKVLTKKYSLYAIKHSFYFYNWNVKSKLEKI